MSAVLFGSARELEGRVCIVTGAGSGIGRGVALNLAASGGCVAVLDRDVAGAEATAAAIKAAGGQGLAVACDVADEAAVAAAAEQTLAALGPCDVLVNNAGVLRPGPLETLTLAEWNLVLGVNLSGYFICSQAWGRQMLAREQGAIVHIASIAAVQPTPYAGAYSVAKAGVTLLSRQLAIEWGGRGIRSNCVNPGLIHTGMTQTIYEQPELAARRAQTVPTGRIGQPDDIAEAVRFLASDRASYVNGEELTVDGGFSRMLLGLIPRTFQPPAR